MRCRLAFAARPAAAGATAGNRLAWTGNRLWIVVLDDTGEVVDVPQPEILVDFNWSIGRRAPRP
jgi:hypothetical protein